MILPTALNGAQITGDPNTTLSLGDLNAISSQVWSHVDRQLTQGTKDAEIDSIKAKSDNLPENPASQEDVYGASII